MSFDLDKVSLTLHRPLTSEELAQKQVKARKVRRYHKWFRAVEVRDGKKCQKCLGVSQDRKLTVHHIVSYDHYRHLRVDVDNGITLCRTCHTEYHREKGRVPTLPNLIDWLGYQPGFTFALERKLHFTQNTEGDDDWN